MASVDEKTPIVTADGTTTSPDSSPNKSKGLDVGITNPLQTFQTLVGIRTPEEIASLWVPKPDSAAALTSQAAGKQSVPPDNSQRKHPNPGIYHRIVKLEKRRKWQYRVCNAFIDVCFIAQIGFAAILTALGASESPHNIITIFGALNTAIAGILALLKGQGLPTRLRQDWVGLRRVRDYIEDRERIIGMKFALMYKDDKNEDVAEDLQTEIQTILKMYDEQMRTMEENRPDVYVLPGAGSHVGTLPAYDSTLGSSAGMLGAGSKATGNTATGDTVVDGLHDLHMNPAGAVKAVNNG